MRDGSFPSFERSSRSCGEKVDPELEEELGSEAEVEVVLMRERVWERSSAVDSGFAPEEEAAAAGVEDG